ncbi:branched-chain amino acid ABC transporter permease [Paraburkholderia sartisoli]|uniref:Amino acid/amide ABC transporter membrane protein 1, HAAT family n=1 Tax=Paraburkholderia sartisoli TaxID=83784 RepID=A0A1H4GTJ8_9BURK|nr:branched-chain amino acid ABC transporter permease [Paraburkholderia sartisoli]SEB12178.1 amino acid/amide ABC transporter membrane protein 1, HAAT family [Paraburkholderia sartisoli]
MSAVVFIALYGVSYGMLLFMMSVGLVITMGLMRVINVAHGAFAAAGGYATYFLMTHYAVPFVLATLLSMVGIAIVGAVIERTLLASLYGASELDQVLLTTGLMFVSMATLNFIFGPDPIPFQTPDFMTGSVHLPGNDFPVYRLFIVAVGLLIMLLLYLLLERTNLGSQLKAAVGNRSMTQAMGIDVRRLFTSTFMLGAALAALAGSIGFAILPLEPTYPFKYLIIVLVIVALTGFGNTKGAARWSLLVGIVDTACRYLAPSAGSYVVYLILVVILVSRDMGLFKEWSAS